MSLKTIQYALYVFLGEGVFSYENPHQRKQLYMYIENVGCVCVFVRLLRLSDTFPCNDIAARFVRHTTRVVVCVGRFEVGTGKYQTARSAV